MDTAFPSRVLSLAIVERVSAPRCSPRKRGRRLPPAVGRLRRPHQGIAQVAQFGLLCSFFDGRCEVLGGASDLVDAVRQLGGLFGGEDDGIRRQ